MRPLEIYQKYHIMPQLVEHQLKVAGVAKALCDNFTVKVDQENILAACLLHDMGNIIKFDLSVTDRLLPGRFSKQDLAKWQEVKDQVIGKYGKDEHQASLAIVRELGLSQRIVELIDCIGFQHGQSNADSADFGKKICAYSDMRVGPLGVISLEQRFEDLRLRYEDKHRLMGGGETARLEFEKGLRQVEVQLFRVCKIRPQEITEEKVLTETENLKNFGI